MQEFKSFEIKKEEIVPLAKKMKENGHRLVMIHGFVDKEGKHVVNYQYEVGNCIESYTVKGEDTLPSISEIYDVAASWPEEELYELMGVKFEGLNMRGRLFLPDTMLEGQGHILVTPLDELRKKTLKEGE
ncbi:MULTISPECIES: NADH-quinone oxidoreductase subunit C [Caloramator]|uniref:Respiratory-chain NADH dehydrogenase, subunit n=1 Tax=Caloramator proteoclasticus DSM 10124 TaxID=1121262 RepID=A0A1M4TDU7_9CLOT|nr:MULTISPECIES: NADH-quinone oxidoreductase subunit C [Caloramator]SHE42656.1 Respiratory-chain NADH dehydrogenase, subunit [Caloramator proteoclasticus DSM 10124]